MMRNLYIDIETIPGPLVPSVEELEFLAPKTMKKAETIRQWAEENQITEYRKQALDSMQGEILAIGYAWNEEPPICLCRGQDMPGEVEVLRAFEQAIEERMELMGQMCPVWIGHNIRSFDLPWLWRKALKYRLNNLAMRIPRERYSKEIEDTMEIWSADYKDRVSLDRIAAFLGIEGKVQGMTGATVYDAWQAGEIERIAGYCMGDVEAVRGVHDIISGLVA